MDKANQGKRDLQDSNVHLFYQPHLAKGIEYLDGEEAHHVRVLRLSVNDRIHVTDGKGLLWHATITSIDKSKCEFEVTKLQNPAKKPLSIHLFVAPTKNSDRMEWLVEKVTELGIASVTMVRCERSERKNINHDRLVKMAVSAMKQSQQAWLPEIKDLTPFGDVVNMKFDQNFIAFVDHTNPDQLKNLAAAGSSYGLLIGPEGDFTQEEIDLAMNSGWKKVSLGPTRLRTETAALMGTLTLVLANN